MNNINNSRVQFGCQKNLQIRIPDKMISVVYLKACLSCDMARNLPMGRRLEPVYMSMKKNTPVVYRLASLGLSAMMRYSRTDTCSTGIHRQTDC